MILTSFIGTTGDGTTSPTLPEWLFPPPTFQLHKATISELGFGRFSATLSPCIRPLPQQHRLRLHGTERHAGVGVDEVLEKTQLLQYRGLPVLRHSEQDGFDK